MSPLLSFSVWRFCFVVDRVLLLVRWLRLNIFICIIVSLRVDINWHWPQWTCQRFLHEFNTIFEESTWRSKQSTVCCGGKNAYIVHYRFVNRFSSSCEWTINALNTMGLAPFTFIFVFLSLSHQPLDVPFFVCCTKAQLQIPLEWTHCITKR